MPQVEKLGDEEIHNLLETLPDWAYDNSTIVRVITFPTFLRAIEFVNAVAHLAERQDHHPDITIQYKRVTIGYWTHTANGLTRLDFEGAKEVEQLIPVFQKERVEAKSEA